MRALTRGLVVALCATFLLVPAHRAQAADPPVIALPEGVWSGVETVTVTTDDPTVLSVVVELDVEDSDQQVTVREPVQAPGAPVEVEVPTWGIGGLVSGVVRLCASTDDPCTGQAVTFFPTIAQATSDAVTADLEIPANPVLLPEEQAWITVHNPGGGKVYVLGTATAVTPIPAGERREIAWPATTGFQHYLTAVRCTDGFTPAHPSELGTARCELFDLAGPVRLVREVKLAVEAEAGHDWVVTDPTAAIGTSLPVRVSSATYEDQALSYRLLDAGGATVLGPVDWIPRFNPGTSSYSRTLAFDPTSLNGGVAFPDGDYTLRITSRITKGEVAKEASRDLALHLDDALPPPDDLPAYKVSRVVRDVRGARPASVSVAGTNDPRYRGTLHVTDAQGKEVWAATTAPDCRDEDCTSVPDMTEPAWYDFSWNGTTTDGAKLPAGEYHAAMTVADSWGRAVEVVDVGSLWIDHLVTETTTRRYTPADSTWSYSTIGRCSSSTKPGPHRWPGSVGILSLSRCRSTAGTDDWAFRTFYLTLRGVPGQHRLISYRASAYGAPVRRGMRGAIASDLSGTFEYPEWRTTGVLSGGLGWHDAARVAPAADTAHRFYAIVQARVANGSKWDIRVWRVSWTYSAWRR